MKAQKSINTITLRRTDGLEVALRVQSETAEYWYGRPTYNAISSNYLKTEWSIVPPDAAPTATPLTAIDPLTAAERELVEFVSRGFPEVPWHLVDRLLDIIDRLAPKDSSK